VAVLVVVVLVEEELVGAGKTKQNLYPFSQYFLLKK
jgi:hypothetical protein